MKPVLTFQSLSGAIAVAVLVATELVAAAAVAIWSIAGLLRLGTVPTLLVGAVIAAPTLFAVVKVSILAFQSETHPENN